MMMYFEFNEDRLIQNHFTQEQCFSVIDKVMNEYGVYANRPGTLIPCTSLKNAPADSSVISSDSTHLICTLAPVSYPPCSKDLIRNKQYCNRIDVLHVECDSIKK